MNIADLRKLAGISEESSMGENLSYTGSDIAVLQGLDNIEPGTPDWFTLWFARPKLTGENPMPKSKSK